MRRLMTASCHPGWNDRFFIMGRQPTQTALGSSVTVFSRDLDSR
jgi:hypothetical protein